MTTKTEKISEELITSIKSLQTEVNTIIYNIGQISVRNREIQMDIERLSELKKETEEKLDTKTLQLENLLSDLQRKYNNAEIDLNDGTITYQVSE